MTARALPTRTLPPHPDLRQIRRQAKQLLDGFIRGDGADVAEVTAHYHGARAATFALHDAQLAIARAYGFESWPKLKAAVQGVTIQRLTDAVRARDLRRVRAMLRLRPELVMEVRYDQLEGLRFRHTVQFERWRPDREPRSCTFAQLDTPVAYDLADVLA